ncbi:hypothetical protein D4L85_02640 [Chryseolinea soli]|uniref:Uncharacterized protein n=1 Tax=Chryseolinea soli TaxID=2321403 RepID=A0A385SEB8_9BACT|nr:hypothetical protein D4L85_02640 [Chryseolinea soli]
MITRLIAVVEAAVTGIFFSLNGMHDGRCMGMKHAMHSLHGQRTQRIQYQQAKHSPGLYSRVVKLMVGAMLHFKNRNNEINVPDKNREAVSQLQHYCI